MELEFAHKLAHRDLVDAGPIERAPLRFHRRGGIDTDQLSRKLGAGAMLRQQRGDSFRSAQARERLDRGEIRVELIQGAEMLDQRGRGLLADSWHALDVVD